MNEEKHEEMDSNMDTTIDTNWDVDKYQSPYEPKQHWELRRKFMESNKSKYPEERLVGLGKAFSNIELMGCKYPKITMDLVEELAFGIVQPFRESQKNRLQPTLVSKITKIKNKGMLISRIFLKIFITSISREKKFRERRR